MKLFLILSLSILSLGLSAKEIPTPKNVKTIKNPTMNHLPFIAADGFVYLLETSNQMNSTIIEADNADAVCKAAGYVKAYSYILNEIQEDSSLVMAIAYDTGVIYERLTYKELETNTGDGSSKEYKSKIFKQISCFTK